MKSLIFFIERNIRGGWVICGVIGYRQYYGYTKSEAKAMYLEECKGKIFFNEKPKKENNNAMD